MACSVFVQFAIRDVGGGLEWVGPLGYCDGAAPISPFIVWLE